MKKGLDTRKPLHVICVLLEDKNKTKESSCVIDKNIGSEFLPALKRNL